MELLLTSCVAFLGGCIGLKLRLPAGALIGAIFATAIQNVAFGTAYMPEELKIFTQAATGAYIGAKITKDDIKQLKTILKPAVLLVSVMLVYAIGVGVLLYSISELSIATALFAMAPAGIADMTLASMDFDAEPSVVALIQTLRIVVAVSLLPPIIKWLHRHHEMHHPHISAQSVPDPVKSGPNKTLPNLCLTLFVGFLFGGAGKLLGVPGGAITFSMAACVIFNVLSNRGYVPLKLRQFIQMFAGALIGCTVGRAQLRQILELRFVVVIAVVSFILLDLIAACVVSKSTGMDMVTALFACSPGGLSDMALIAEEMGANSLTVVGMHSFRLIATVAFYPIIIHGFLSV